jgi:Condensation domain/TubC N-terminal docking domain
MPQKLSQPLDRIADVLVRIGKKGVKLRTENGQLLYRATKGSLTDEEIEVLRFHKDQIVSMLESAINVELGEPTASSWNRESAVLSFSQEAHWRRYRLHSRPGAREIASATRMTGRLDVELFRSSVAEISCRHAGLRTRIVMCNGTPTQHISEAGDFEFEVQDLTALSYQAREIEVMRSIDELILRPIDVSVGPLWGVRLLRLSNEEHVLIVIMEHIISDNVSLQILLRDIFSAYAQLSRGVGISLPAIPIQFAEYAERQRKMFGSRARGDSYWTTRLSGCPRVRFPCDSDLLTNVQPGWGYVRVRMISLQRVSLSTWSRLRKTTPSMAAFTAYVALVSRWCGVSDIVINYVIDGRTSDKVRNTIGFFAKRLPIRVELHRDDVFASLLKRITAEYCKAYERANFYDMDAHIPAPDFAPNSYFNWIAREDCDSSVVMKAAEDGIRCLPVFFEPPMRENVEIDAEPSILLYDTDSGLSGGIFFPKNRFSLHGMHRFASNFGIFMDALLERPDGPIYDVAML